jgi:hypothetical protein
MTAPRHAVNGHGAKIAELQDYVAAIGRLLDVDLDELVLSHRAVEGTPSTWEEMKAAGFDPQTGEPL